MRLGHQARTTAPGGRPLSQAEPANQPPPGATPYYYGETERTDEPRTRVRGGPFFGLTCAAELRRATSDRRAARSSRGGGGRRFCEVPGDPCGHGSCGVFRCPGAGIDPLGDVAAEPLAERDLLLDIPAAPGRPGCDAGAAQFIGAVEHDEVDVPDPSPGGESLKVLGDERAEQHGGQPALGDAVGDRQPGVAERGPVDRLAATERLRGVQEPVDVEGDASAREHARERGEHGGLPRA
jgi:hypothetical protein